MQYNIDFEVASLIFIVLLYVYFHVQFDEPTVTSRVFKSVLLSTIIANALDIVTAIYISYPQSVSTSCNYALNSLYFVSNLDDSLCKYGISLLYSFFIIL